MLVAVIHGAGGMEMIDPLFQRILVTECQSRKIPVIFDEVFTGFWRLGAEVGLLYKYMSTCLLLAFQQMIELLFLSSVCCQITPLSA